LSISKRIENDGFAVVPNVISETKVAELIATVGKADFVRSTRGDDVCGARNILAVPEIAALACDTEIVSLVADVIGADCRAVRGIFFDKTPGANWPVVWHQDLSLAVAEQHDVAGWGNWSIKAGIQHVQPPAETLEQMVTLRIQLDDSDADNGPLRVLRGSHRLGKVSPEKIKTLRAEVPETTCIASAGSVLAMKPLILHASSAARKPAHRRVIHLEFAPYDLLPPGLSWAFIS
jgi:ectoine hydroxylase-related dioxygenase (phytanoyl-CoA dioxygenase family)